MKLSDLRILCIKGANHIGIASIAVIIGRSIVTERKTSNKWNALQGMKGWWNLIMMTRREAIEALEYLISGECTDTQMDYVDEIQMAITDMKICDANNAGWISVKDRLPDEQGTFLVFRKEPYGMITIAWYSGHENGWLALDGGFYADGVLTHYMPLPEPPKEG